GVSVPLKVSVTAGADGAVGVVGVSLLPQAAAVRAAANASTASRRIPRFLSSLNHPFSHGGAPAAVDPSDRLRPVFLAIPQALDRFCYRFPSLLVDSILEHEPGRRLVAVKNVTVDEEFFQGHFPGAPLLPAVLMIESLSQVASILLIDAEPGSPRRRVYLRGVNDAKFRRQVVPGDRLRLEISIGRRRATLARAQATAFVGDQIVAECELLLGVVADETRIDPSAIVDRSARVGRGTTVG